MSTIAQIKRELDQRLTPEEVARLLRISRSAVWRWMQSGKLAYFRIGSRRFIKPESIANLLKPQSGLGSGQLIDVSDAEREIDDARVSRK